MSSHNGPSGNSSGKEEGSPRRRCYEFTVTPEITKVLSEFYFVLKFFEKLLKREEKMWRITKISR